MFAERIGNLVDSPVREILKVIDQPGMVSFAGGLPAQDCFPEFDYSCISPAHLQYGPSEGEAALRDQIAHSLSERGLETSAERVLILSGSQQGIDLVSKLFIEPGVKVAVETPTYLAALQSFDLFGAHYSGFSVDSPKVSGTRLTYTIPTFQNPTGHCYSSAQRKALAAACTEAGSVLFEDDPYRELAYSDCDRTPVCSFIGDSPWIYQSSFSKIYAPGLRLGYLTCSESLFPDLIRLKQAADLHSCRISQHLILSMLQNSEDDRDLIGFYRARRDNFHKVLLAEFSHLADWEVPSGGLFFWLRLKPEFTTYTGLLLQKSISEGVAFMPGEAFYPAGCEMQSSLRLNFSHASPEDAEKGLRKLARIIEASVAVGQI